jgi:hypothetical protein
MRRINGILTAALVFQLLLFGSLIAFCGPEPTHIEPVAVLGELKPDAVERITIAARSGDEVDELVLEHDGERWRLPGQHGYPADAKKVDELLGKLTGLRSSRVVARGEEHRVDLKVTDETFRRKITLTAGEAQHVLYLGDNAAGRAVCLRSELRPETFASAEIQIWDIQARPASWYAQPYFEIDGQRLVSIRIQGPQQRLELQRASSDDWRLDGRPIEAEKLDDLLDRLERIELDGVRAAAGSDAAEKALAGAEKRWTVELAMADAALQPAAADGEVPDPQPLAGEQGDAADEDKPAAEGDEAQDAAEDAAADQAAEPPELPAIVQRHQLTVATQPEAENKLLVQVDSSDYLVEVSRYRLTPIIEVDPAELRGEEEAAD